MAPFRSRDRSNRSGRGQIEHNVLEGIPINQYRETEMTVGLNLADNKPIDKNAWPELPMPRDSLMLPEHSLQILRAARSGRIHRPPPPPDDDNEMKEEEDEHKEIQTGFTVKKYVKVPRHLEVAEPEYLAKRRKGLPSPYVNGELVQTAFRETKIRMLDAEGNIAVYKVLVPEGQIIEGEIHSTDAIVETAPDPTVLDTVVKGDSAIESKDIAVVDDATQQTLPRQRPPPQKKKSKRAGPGRGKKRVLFAEDETDQGTPVSNADSDSVTASVAKQDEGSPPVSDEEDTPVAGAEADDDKEELDDGGQDGNNASKLETFPSSPAAPTNSLATNLADATIDMTASETVLTSKSPTAMPPETQAVDSGKDALSATSVPTQDANEHNVESGPSISLENSPSGTLELRQKPPHEMATSVTHTNPAAQETEVASTPTETVIPSAEVGPLLSPTGSPPPEPLPKTQPELKLAMEATAAPSDDSSTPALEFDLLESLERHLEKDSENILNS